MCLGVEPEACSYDGQAPVRPPPRAAQTGQGLWGLPSWSWSRGKEEPPARPERSVSPHIGSGDPLSSSPIDDAAVRVAEAAKYGLHRQDAEAKSLEVLSA
eukprot:scaffold952_cov249-Pinguiococcus_pyrenoidosus.AAC.16